MNWACVWITAPLLLMVGSIAMRFTSPYVGLAIGAAVWAAAAYGLERKFARGST